ncbi:WecB/TagA/CpsF family glycosyltransferase [Bradyrhizobium guangdongense]|uniref:WecB/TagA/CpsF family glycosyltransferase n=1 Tax=Bradyrhizobium guangdongense TaxID=1325090 RepID=UPI001FEE5A1C|nr:WecB/TagA/CpsF family glycosyltransferase [Bradyrhizobium guangdongense]
MPQGSPRVAVLVPAHNEGVGILPTIRDIKAQIGKQDRLLVVADNCDDDTASVARDAGAEVVERNDSGLLGKGYALDFGIRHLGHAPPDVVVMIDADCGVSMGAIRDLASECARTGRPVQGLYLMLPPVATKIQSQVAVFAWRVKNWVRPLGLRALNLPCQLMGSGMAFPWNVICSAPLASGEIVEDLKLGLSLAQRGHPPLFLPSAIVTSRFPSSDEGTRTQRERWEHGHLSSIAEAPHLVWKAASRLDLATTVLALDMAVPPLSLLALLSILITLVSGFAAHLSGNWSAAILSFGSLCAFSFAVLGCWLVFGRDVLPLRAIVSIPAYALKKIPLYLRALFGTRASYWIRTDRTGTKAIEVDAEQRILIAPNAQTNESPRATGNDILRDAYGIFGIPIDCVSWNSVFLRLESAVKERVPFLISTPNLNFLIASMSDANFRSTLLFSDLCPPDGMPIVWLAKLFGVPIKTRIAGSDIFEALKLRWPQHAPLKVFLFGGAEGVAEEASRRINSRPGGLLCVGSFYPGFGSVDEMSDQSIIEVINDSGADLLVVALGAQKGQIWLKCNHYRLTIPVRSHLGATLNFEAGTITRAPRILRGAGLEWLWRIKEEPVLWRRYWHDGLEFLQLFVTRVLPLLAFSRWYHFANNRSDAISVSFPERPHDIVIQINGAAIEKNVGQVAERFMLALDADRDVLLDLVGVTRIDSRFIGLILMLSKELERRGRTLRFGGISAPVSRLFRLGGFEFLLAKA